jgi:hypothetical protein
MEASTPTAAVTPHATSVVVWDVPSAIVTGEKFRIKVGIKCSNECHLTNTDFGIYDDEGRQIATGTLSDERWPGTTGIYVAEVELAGPAGEGLHTWSVSGQHAEGSSSFGVRVVSPPDCLVKVAAVDQITRAPLSGARVVMHPYKAVSNEHGVAEVRVAKGTYTLFVAQTGYFTFVLPVDVQADLTARAELSMELPPERN